MDTRTDLLLVAKHLTDDLFANAEDIARTLDGASIELELRLTVTDGNATAVVPTGIEGYVDSDGTWHYELPLTVEAFV